MKSTHFSASARFLVPLRMPANSICRKHAPGPTTLAVGASAGLGSGAKTISAGGAEAVAAGAGEVVVVRGLPALHDLHVILAQLLPKIEKRVRPEVDDRGEHEGEARRGGGRVLDHQQALVFRPGQALQRLRRLGAILRD